MDEEKPYILAFISSSEDFVMYPKEADRVKIEQKLDIKILKEAPITKHEAVEFVRDGIRAVR